MRYFLYVNNPRNFFKREYWSPRALLTRVIFGLFTNYAAHRVTKWAIDRADKNLDARLKALLDEEEAVTRNRLTESY